MPKILELSNTQRFLLTKPDAKAKKSMDKTIKKVMDDIDDKVPEWVTRIAQENNIREDQVKEFLVHLYIQTHF